MDKKLLDILICPKTKGPLTHDKKNNELISKKGNLAYPIKDGSNNMPHKFPDNPWRKFRLIDLTLLNIL